MHGTGKKLSKRKTQKQSEENIINRIRKKFKKPEILGDFLKIVTRQKQLVISGIINILHMKVMV